MLPAFPKKGPMFPDMYVTGEHRTLSQKKGSMFPGLLLFPPLLPNSGRDNYHCMSLPFVEEGETSENMTQSIHTPVNKPRTIPTRAPRATAIRRRTELLAVILLYNYIILYRPTII